MSSYLVYNDFELFNINVYKYKLYIYQLLHHSDIEQREDVIDDLFARIRSAFENITRLFKFASSHFFKQALFWTT